MHLPNLHIVIVKKVKLEIYLYELFCLFCIISTQTIYLYQKFYEMNGFVKLRAVSKLSTFLIHPDHVWALDLAGTGPVMLCRAANYCRTPDNVRLNLANVRAKVILIGHWSDHTKKIVTLYIFLP